MVTEFLLNRSAKYNVRLRQTSNPQKIMKRTIKNSCLAIALSLSALVTTGLVGCSPSNPPERTSGEYVDDKALNSRVRSALSDHPDYKFSEVNVTSFRGVVQLSGFVNTADQKQKAGEIAKAVTGAKSVENSITVKDKIQP